MGFTVEPVRGGSSRRRQGFGRDVVAELCAVETNFLHRGVGGGLRAFQILAQRGYAQHAATVRDDIVPCPGGAGMENFC